MSLPYRLAEKLLYVIPKPPSPRVLHVSIKHTPSLDEKGSVCSTHGIDQLIYNVLLISVVS